MPYINYLDSDSLKFTEEAEYTIIGAGAAGIFLAITLQNLGHKVLVIESGHFEIDKENQKLNEVEFSMKEMNNAVWGRKRAIGGTTLAWGGQSLPFSKSDFEKKSWVSMSGWPIDYNTLAEHYKVANSFMKIDTLNYDTDIFKRIKINDSRLCFNKLRYHVSKWAREPNFKRLYNHILSEKIYILYNAVLTKIVKYPESDEVKSIIVSNQQKKSEINVSNVIIATGGIESVRILLNNRANFPKSDGLHSGSLGLGFMDHPCLEIGEVTGHNNYKLQKFFGTHFSKRRKYSIRLSLSDTFQENNKLLNASASIMFKAKNDAFDPYAELRSFNPFKMSKWGVFLRTLLKAPMMMKAVLFDNFLFKPETSAVVTLMTEQEPSIHSSIYLSEKKDIYGLQLAKIHWDISDLTWKTIISCTNAIEIELKQNNLGTLISYDTIKADNANWKELLSDVNHHMGGTRMGSDSECSVVDRNLKVWGIPNLYVCSSSVFPTSSHSNPTLTLLALANRLCEQLNSNVQREHKET